MTAVKTADRVVVSVTATDSGDWQVVSIPTGFQGIVATLFAENDYLHGFVRHEDGEQWEVYDFNGGDNTKLLQVTSISGTVTLARPATPYDSSKSDGTRIDAGSGTHTMTLSLGSGTLKRIFRELSPFWKSFADADTSPSVADYRFFKTTGTATIVRFDDLTNGQGFWVRRGNADIIIAHDGTNIDLFGAANLTLTASSPSAYFAVESGVAKQMSGYVAPLDEDDFASNSASRPPSQQSAKAYIDAKVEDAIVDGVTTKAPSQNAVNDALALKVNTSLVGVADGLAQLAANSKHKPSQVIRSAPNGAARTFVLTAGWKASTPTANNWTDVCWSPYLGLFAAVGTSGTGNRVMTSPDGVTWTTRTSAADITWNAICWSEEKKLFVAVGTGTSNGIMTSPDGITWTTVVPPTDAAWASVCWAAEIGLFCAVASSGTGNRAMTSPDGITWTLQTQANATTAVSWSPELNLFCAVGQTGSNRVYTSPDGLTWTARNAADTSASWQAVCWAGRLGLFVAVNNTSTGNRVMTSPDGITWTSRNSVSDNNWNAICWAEDMSLLVAVANSGTGGRIMTSPDGIVWTAGASTADNNWNGVAYTPSLGMVAAVANSGTDRVMSTTGTTSLSVRNNTVKKFKYLADLLAYPDALLADGDLVHIAHRSARADGGGGKFVVVPLASSPWAADNLGVIYASAGAAYVFIREQFLDDGRVNPRWFGALGAGADETTALNNWLNTYDTLDVQGTATDSTTFSPWLFVPAGKFYWGTKRAWYPKSNSPILRGLGYKSQLVNLTIGLCCVTSTSSLRFAQVSDICLNGLGSNDIGISLGHPYKWANGLQTAASFALNVTTTAGSANATMTSTASLTVGQAVTSANIPFGSTVQSITNGTTFVIGPPDNVAAGVGVTAGTSVSTTFGGNNWGGPQECRISRVRVINHSLAGIINTRDNMSRLEEVYSEFNVYNLLMISGVDTEFNGCHFRYADLDNIRIQPWQGNNTTGALTDLAGGYSMTDCSARGANRHNFFATGGTRDTAILTTDTAYAGQPDLDWFTSHPQMTGATSQYVGDLWECYFWNCSWANISTDNTKWQPRTLTVTAIVNGITTPTSNIRVTCSTPHYFTKNLLFENGMIDFDGTGISAYDSVALTPSGGRKITDVIDQYTFEVNIAYSSAFSGTATLKVPNYEFKIIGQEKAWTPKSIKDLWFSGKNTNFCFFERCQDIYASGCRFKNQVVIGDNVIGFQSDHALGITPDVTNENLYVPYTGAGWKGGWIRGAGVRDYNVTSGVTKTPDNTGWGVERAYSSSTQNVDGSAATLLAVQLRSGFAFMGAWTRDSVTPTDVVSGLVARGTGQVEWTLANVAKVTFRASDSIITIGNTATSPGASSSITSSGLALNGPLAPINAGGYQVPAAILNRVNTTGSVVSLRYNGTEYGSITMGTDYAAFVGKNTAKSAIKCTFSGGVINTLDAANTYNVTSAVRSSTGVTVITFPARIDTKFICLVQQMTADPINNLACVDPALTTTTTVTVKGFAANGSTAKDVDFSLVIYGG